MKQKHRILVITTLIVLVGLILGMGIRVMLFPNRIIVQNSSGEQIRDFVLVLSTSEEKWRLEKKVDTLAPNAKFTIHHNQKNVAAEFRYVLEGVAHEQKESYIDLWRGEDYFFDIQADGVVHACYESSRHDPKTQQTNAAD